MTAYNLKNISVVHISYISLFGYILQFLQMWLRQEPAQSQALVWFLNHQLDVSRVFPGELEGNLANLDGQHNIAGKKINNNASVNCNAVKSTTTFCTHIDKKMFDNKLGNISMLWFNLPSVEVSSSAPPLAPGLSSALPCSAPMQFQ